MQDIPPKPECRVKKGFSIDHVINWYIGNYLESPNNAIRDDSFDPDKEDWQSVWQQDIKTISAELKGKRISHSDFIYLMKEKGIHNK